MDSRIREIGLDLYRPAKVVIVGAGGIGSWMALFLTIFGVKEINIFDEDKIEAHNLNRTFYKPSDVGKYKVDALKEFLDSLEREVDIFVFREKFSSDLLLERWYAAVFDCSDDYNTQKEVFLQCKELGLKYFRCGTREDRITATETVPLWATEEEEGECGVVIPQWLVPQVIVSALTLWAVAKIKPVDISYELKNLYRRTKYRKRKQRRKNE